LVEREPSKLGVAGSSPVSRSNLGRILRGSRTDKLRTNAHVAQSVEHFLGKEEVTGSNPVVGFAAFASARADAVDDIRTGK
jgi:hypothetical protein